jgi:hypothetical protein
MKTTSKFHRAFQSAEFTIARQYLNQNQLTAESAMEFDNAITQLCEVLGFNRTRTIDWVFRNAQSLV